MDFGPTIRTIFLVALSCISLSAADPCSPDPCYHGTCIPYDVINDFLCTCDNGYYGTFCNESYFPGYAIGLIVAGGITLLGLLLWFLYRSRRTNGQVLPPTIVHQPPPMYAQQYNVTAHSPGQQPAYNNPGFNQQYNTGNKY